MAKDECKVGDMLRTLYERNEQYHDIKERVVWLAGVVYFTFSVFVLRWIPDHKDIWAKGKLLPILTMVFLTLMFIVTIVFIICQTKEKAGTVKITKKLRCLIGDLDKESTEPYKTLIKQTNPEKAKKEAHFFREGWSGVLILSTVLIFYGAQVVILYTGRCNIPLLLYGFVFALALSNLCLSLTCCLSNG